MTVTEFTARDMAGLLLSVGVDPGSDPAEQCRTFEQLQLDSLARVEIASRIRDRVGVDLESCLTPDRTPAEVTELVNAALTEGAGNGGSE